MDLLFIILSIPLIFFFLAILAGFALSEPGYDGPESDHFDGKRFQNPNGVKAKGFKDILKWLRKGRATRVWKEDKSPPPNVIIPPSQVGECHITFINHSSFLLQLESVHLLIDPVWSTYASPFQFAGPKRMRQPGLSLESLPRIDYVLLSHNHYDHLDLSTLKKIRKVHHPEFIVPLGVDLFMKRKGFDKVTSIDWWAQCDLGKITLTSMPAQHFSGRGMFDRDRTLWCGYALRSDHYNIYYAGDSGYGEFFKEIGHRAGPFDAAMIPIGAFKPQWFMQPIHVSPKEAIWIHKDVQSNKSIACHFGTFPLADDSMDEPVHLLKEHLKENGMTNTEFLVPAPGKRITL